MEKKVSDFIFSAFRSAFDFMQPHLSNYQKFSHWLSRKIRTKNKINVQYNFDLKLDELVKKQLRQHNITGTIFSEESGWFKLDNARYHIIYDPFCNSTLATKTFHEAAIGISVFNQDRSFLTSAIMDYQTGIVGIVEKNKTNFYQIQTKKKIPFFHSKTTRLKNAWTVITLENHQERKHLKRAEIILRQSKRILIASGHIYWLKLAMGIIDAYLDPFGGEPLYEMFACTIAQKNGCIVTDLKGNHFNPNTALKLFKKNRGYIYYPVAATNKKLHSILLTSLFTK